MAGMLGIVPYKGAGDVYQNFVENVAERNATFGGYGTSASQIQGDAYATYNYDAIYAFGYAIQHVTKIYI